MTSSDQRGTNSSFIATLFLSSACFQVDRHPNAEKLYLEEIDLGEEKPRQVCEKVWKCGN